MLLKKIYLYLEKDWFKVCVLLCFLTAIGITVVMINASQARREAREYMVQRDKDSCIKDAQDLTVLAFLPICLEDQNPEDCKRLEWTATNAFMEYYTAVSPNSPTARLLKSYKDRVQACNSI